MVGKKISKTIWISRWKWNTRRLPRLPTTLSVISNHSVHSFFDFEAMGRKSLKTVSTHFDFSNKSTDCIPFKTENC
ncbi:hypothetical protein HMPREF3213_01987 [Heyndrickxia coagulans]|uniref:Uncharacterized protein n=1 Tax=Heyndrickxia coagulans TaxID=1398 RepID=A0A133KQ09_HEYCO|nr:hypothetical protein HMPREF3213_01987 [Heyndrickxia coagulans]